VAKYVCPMCGEWNREDQKYCRKCNTWLLDTTHQSKRVTSFFRKNGCKDYKWVTILLFIELLITAFIIFESSSRLSKNVGGLLIFISLANIFIAMIFSIIALLRRRRMGALRLTLTSLLTFVLGLAVLNIHDIKREIANLPTNTTSVKSIPTPSNTIPFPANSIPIPAKPALQSKAPIANPTILSHLESRETTFSVPVNTSSAEILKNDVADALKSDEYLALSIRSYRFNIVTFGQVSTATFSVNYWEDWTQYKAVQSGVSQVLKQIIKPSMDDFAKEKAIHDYVVLCVAYDESDTRYSAYDALFNRSAVCQGYAMLTYQLLKATGIPNDIVIGSATNSLGTVAHSWNEVELHGKWYQLDTTWDDPVPDVPGRVLYNYFNLTDAQIALNHTWSRDGLPVANTDYVKTLQSIGSLQDQKIANETGLVAEESQATYTDLGHLQAVLANQKLGSYVFRFPYSQVGELRQLQLHDSARWSYTKDTRDTEYAIVNMTIG
jgi:hypothetical protein